MTEPYYTGDSIPMGISVTENDLPLAVVSATVSFHYQGDTTPLIDGVTADVGGVNNNEVTYLVPKGTTTKGGTHRGYFVCKFSADRERTYEFEFNIIANPRFR